TRSQSSIRMPSGESMYTLSNPPAANSQSTSSYPMPLTVRLIASTNGASIGNTLRTPKMKNGPGSPLFEEAGFEGALGSGRPRQSRLPRGPVWNVPASDKGDQALVAMPDSSNWPPRPKMHRHARIAGAPLPAHSRNCPKPGDFSSERL